MAARKKSGARTADAAAAQRTAAETGSHLEKPLRPAQCREYMRQVLAREFRSIVDGFVQEARAGSCQHVKLATELVNAPPVRRRQKSSIEKIREAMERRGRELQERGESAAR